MWKGESTLRFLLGLYLDSEARLAGWPQRMEHLVHGNRGEGDTIPLCIFLSPCCIHQCPA